MSDHLSSIESLLELGKSYALFHAHGELEAAIVDAIPALVERVRELEADMIAADRELGRMRDALGLAVDALRSCHAPIELHHWNTIRRAMGEAGGGDE